MYELRRRIISRLRGIFRQNASAVENSMVYRMSRDEAFLIRQSVVQAKGRTIVDRALKKKIREYSRERFGKTTYWPWLALYTEIRGDFKKGWIPCDYFRFHLLPKWNHEKELSRLKSLDYRLFPGFAVRPVAVRIRGKFYDMNQKELNRQEVISKCKSLADEIVIKMDGGHGGKSIQFVTRDELPGFKWNLIRNAVIQPVVKQHQSLHELHPYSINTLRIITFIEDTGNIKGKFIELRFGRGKSRVDNTSSGGEFLFLDRNGFAITNAYDDLGNESGDKHPDTEIEYKDLHIPSVDKAVSACCKAHSNFSYVRVIAWDIYIDEIGIPKMLEWNASNPSMWFEEALLGPFWPDCKVRYPE